MVGLISITNANGDNRTDIIIENEIFKLTIGSNAEAKSLIVKSSGEECLMHETGIKAFTVTQERPYNNEVKLAYPNKRRTFRADTVYWHDENSLAIGFEIVPYQAVISIDITPQYVRFALKDFIIEPNAYPSYMKITPPPATEICILQLPVRNRAHFGEWLNVVWDNDISVNILATDEFAQIDSEERKGYHILRANAVKDIKFKDAGAALIASETDHLLDKIGQIEEDYSLPKGVKSRRSDLMNASYYWAANLNPTTLEQHLKYAKMGGFRLMLVYFTSFEDNIGLRKIGNFEFNKQLYPNGKEDLSHILARIKKEGIISGVHFLHSNIGRSSKYVTPIPDYRLNIVKSFNLSRSLDKNSTVIYVDQNPEGITIAEGCRVLRAGTELISYENYTTTYPYMFTGCERGIDKTTINSLPEGAVIGLMDVSEYGANSIYIDQHTSLQDEVAEEMARIYETGFEFIYFDGSEGVNPPFNYTVPLAQYRVFKRLKPDPLFSEGAAKSHFSWHMLSGGNAFDIFPPEYLKTAIGKYPADEAPRMRNDFTRINFGWLGYVLPDINTVGTQPDMLEYATSKAAAWNCPISLQANLQRFTEHPRTTDNMEVLRRWEKARADHWLTSDQKKMLENMDQEYHLLINEQHQFELVPYDQIKDIANNNNEIRAFLFKRESHWYVLFWHISGEKRLSLPVKNGNIFLYKNLFQKEPFEKTETHIILPASGQRYLKFENSTREEILKLFKHASILD